MADLTTPEGVDEDPDADGTREPGPATAGGALPAEPPASPAPTDVPRPPAPGQEVQEGEG